MYKFGTSYWQKTATTICVGSSAMVGTRPYAITTLKGIKPPMRSTATSLTMPLTGACGVILVRRVPPLHIDARLLARSDVNTQISQYLSCPRRYHIAMWIVGRKKTLDPQCSSAVPLTTRAEGINDIGVISGEYVDLNGIEHGFMLHSGTVTSIDVPQLLSTDIWMVANNDAFAGDYSDPPQFTDS